MATPNRRIFGTLDKRSEDSFRARYLGPDGIRYSHTFAKRAHADAWLSKAHVAISEGTWLPPGTEAPEPDSFREFAERFLVERELAARTRALYRSLLDRFLLPTFGEMAVEDIRIRHVKSWHATLCPNRPTQRAHAYGLLRTILGEAVREELLVSNPANIRRAGSTKRVRAVRLLTDEELEAVLRALTDAQTRLMIRTMAECALRFGEAAALVREDVLNPAVGDVRIHVQRSVVALNGQRIVKAPKSAAGVRIVPVHRSVSDELLVHALTLAPGALLFPGADGLHVSPWVLNRVWRAALAKAEVEPARLHDLRHRGGMALVRAGASQKATMRFMGHSSAAAHAVYLHANDDELRLLVDSR